MAAFTGEIIVIECSRTSNVAEVINNPETEILSPVSEQEDDEVGGGKITNKIKKNIIEAFKEYPYLWNTTGCIKKN
jgi:hypothetical protein